MTKKIFLFGALILFLAYVKTHGASFNMVQVGSTNNPGRITSSGVVVTNADIYAGSIRASNSFLLPLGASSGLIWQSVSSTGQGAWVPNVSSVAITNVASFNGNGALLNYAVSNQTAYFKNLFGGQSMVIDDFGTNLVFSVTNINLAGGTAIFTNALPLATWSDNNMGSGTNFPSSLINTSPTAQTTTNKTFFNCISFRPKDGYSGQTVAGGSVNGSWNSLFPAVGTLLTNDVAAVNGPSTGSGEYYGTMYIYTTNANPVFVTNMGNFVYRPGLVSPVLKVSNNYTNYVIARIATNMNQQTYFIGPAEICPFVTNTTALAVNIPYTNIGSKAVVTASFIMTPSATDYAEITSFMTSLKGVTKSGPIVRAEAFTGVAASIRQVVVCVDPFSILTLSNTSLAGGSVTITNSSVNNM